MNLLLLLLLLLSFFLSVLLLWSPILTQQETPLEWGWWNEQKYDNLMISQGKKIAIVAKIMETNPFCAFNSV